MNGKRAIRKAALVSALLAVLGATGVAFAVDEVEPNNPVASAQVLTIGSDGTVTVNGFIGNTAGYDVDYFSFQGKQGDVVTIDIDGAGQADGSGLDTNIAIFGPATMADGSFNPLAVWQQNDDGGVLDPGSASFTDSYIQNFVLPADGTYVVGVTGMPASFVDVNTLTTNNVDANSTGAYTLIISGVTPPAVTPPVVTPPADTPPPPVVTPPPPPPSVQSINIDIKPGRRDVTVLPSPSVKLPIPVALLSSPNFDALQVDRKSLRFGETGDEESLISCDPHGRDVNRDGRADLVCYFDNRKADFEIGDTQGVLKGTAAGSDFEGRGWLKVLPGKRRDWHRWQQRHHHHDDHDHDRDRADRR